MKEKSNLVNKDLKWIKKHYGEKMMKMCRMHFSTILDTPRLLPIILKTNFYENKSLFNDIISQDKVYDFKDYIYSKHNECEKRTVETTKNPYELMNEAGYILYKCKTKKEMECFKNFYNEKEELCTFLDDRLNRCDVFFAIKKNVKDISRNVNPKRQDDYGTSVLSIQFNKGNYNNVSIKNRYNHTVDNPDATFNNNLDNIIEGLTHSFIKFYNYNITNSYNDFELNNYVLGPDNRFYKFNIEINGVYYCIDNIMIKENDITFYEKEKYLLIENNLLDLTNKKIKDLSLSGVIFEYYLNDIQKIEVIRNKAGKKILIKEYGKKDLSIITLDVDNAITSLNLPNVKKIYNNFFDKNIMIEEVILPEVVSIGLDFLYSNLCLQTVVLPKVESIYDGFLYSNNSLVDLNCPSLKIVGDSFLRNNNKLENLQLPSVWKIKDFFVCENDLLEELTFDNLVEVGHMFLHKNKVLKSLNVPVLDSIGDDFLYSNINLSQLDLSSTKKIGDFFLFWNENIENLLLSNLEVIGDYCLYENRGLKILNLPNVKVVGKDFLFNNCNINEFSLSDVLVDGFYIPSKKKVLK